MKPLKCTARKTSESKKKNRRFSSPTEKEERRTQLAPLPSLNLSLNLSLSPSLSLNSLSLVLSLSRTPLSKKKKTKNETAPSRPSSPSPTPPTPPRPTARRCSPAATTRSGGPAPGPSGAVAAPPDLVDRRRAVLDRRQRGGGLPHELNSEASRSRNNYARPAGQQNVGNYLTGRPSSRVLAPPGGATSIVFGDDGGSEGVGAAADLARRRAAPYAVDEAPMRRRRRRWRRRRRRRRRRHKKKKSSPPGHRRKKKSQTLPRRCPAPARRASTMASPGSARAKGAATLLLPRAPPLLTPHQQQLRALRGAKRRELYQWEADVEGPGASRGQVLDHFRMISFFSLFEKKKNRFFLFVDVLSYVFRDFPSFLCCSVQRYVVSSSLIFLCSGTRTEELFLRVTKKYKSKKDRFRRLSLFPFSPSSLFSLFLSLLFFLPF